MFNYMFDNPCYEFSVGSIKTCLELGTPTPDLNSTIEDETGVLDMDEELEINDATIKGVRFNKFGMHSKVYDKDSKEYDLIKISELGMDNVALLACSGHQGVGRKSTPSRISDSLSPSVSKTTFLAGSLC